ncbi:MAG: DNA repair protein RecO [Verrucomicrobiales bacterium]|jgi:DNA repair protein RecO (recombination protein O)|nr:DNA repair protein RecO [Verrucomicrobiales bacterium]
MEDQGIILRRLPYSETSLIVSWLTERHGLVRTLAKGAAKPRQPLYGRTDVFSQGRVCWAPSARSQLHILREVTVEQANRELAKSYASLLAATYFGEVIELLVEPQHPEPEIFDLFRKALGYLRERPASALLVERFERKLLGILGLNHSGQAIEQLRRHAYPRQPKTYRRLKHELTHSPTI